MALITNVTSTDLTLGEFLDSLLEATRKTPVVLKPGESLEVSTTEALSPLASRLESQGKIKISLEEELPNIDPPSVGNFLAVASGTEWKYLALGEDGQLLQSDSTSPLGVSFVDEPAPSGGFEQEPTSDFEVVGFFPAEYDSSGAVTAFFDKTVNLPVLGTSGSEDKVAVKTYFLSDGETVKSLSLRPTKDVLAITLQSSPYLHLYDLESNFTLLDSPAEMPSGSTSRHACCWDPTGRYLYVGFLTSPYHILYDWDSGSPVDYGALPSFPYTSQSSCSWSPDGRWLILTLNTYGSVDFTGYDWNSGSPVYNSFSGVTGTLHTNAGAGISMWSPDSRYLLFYGGAGISSATLYDWDSGSPVVKPLSFLNPSIEIYNCAFNLASNKVASCAYGTPNLVLSLWDIGSSVTLQDSIAIPETNTNGLLVWEGTRIHLIRSPATSYETASGSLVEIESPFLEVKPGFEVYTRLDATVEWT